MRTFEVIRDIDRSGISGTGKVAEGTEYTDGVCTLHWLTKWNSTVVYPNIQHVINIHGHDGATRFVFHDDDVAIYGPGDH